MHIFLSWRSEAPVRLGEALGCPAVGKPIQVFHPVFSQVFHYSFFSLNNDMLIFPATLGCVTARDAGSLVFHFYAKEELS